MGLDETNKNVSALLLTVGGVSVEVKLVDDEVQYLRFKKNKFCQRNNITIRLHKRFNTNKISDSAYLYTVIR